MSNTEYKPFTTVSEMAEAYSTLRYRVSKTFESIYDRAEEVSLLVSKVWDGEKTARSDFALYLGGQAFKLMGRIDRYRRTLSDSLRNYSEVDSAREEFIAEIDSIENAIKKLGVDKKYDTDVSGTARA